ncbi:hypothetical protein [Planctomycetes bacterium K23_9]|uniref:Uncharacterized protein n=1 Tax=Stieleria marina TaxID=1930275 RepID=A0A517NV70_9BACT|nr:hypothetical protein K239x_30100 [Planctomycetes bacterium K23_9]
MSKMMRKYLKSFLVMALVAAVSSGVAISDDDKAKMDSLFAVEKYPITHETREQFLRERHRGHVQLQELIEELRNGYLNENQEVQQFVVENKLDSKTLTRRLFAQRFARNEFIEYEVSKELKRLQQIEPTDPNLKYDVYPTIRVTKQRYMLLIRRVEQQVKRIKKDREEDVAEVLGGNFCQALYRGPEIIT